MIKVLPAFWALQPRPAACAAANAFAEAYHQYGSDICRSQGPFTNVKHWCNSQNSSQKDLRHRLRGNGAFRMSHPGSTFCLWDAQKGLFGCRCSDCLPQMTTCMRSMYSERGGRIRLISTGGRGKKRGAGKLVQAVQECPPHPLLIRVGRAHLYFASDARLPVAPIP